MPSVFDICLMEVDDEIECDQSKQIQALTTENSKLRLEIEQLKSRIQSEKSFRIQLLVV